MLCTQAVIFKPMSVAGIEKGLKKLSLLCSNPQSVLRFPTLQSRLRDSIELRDTHHTVDKDRPRESNSHSFGKNIGVSLFHFL